MFHWWVSLRWLRYRTIKLVNTGVLERGVVLKDIRSLDRILDSTGEGGRHKSIRAGQSRGLQDYKSPSKVSNEWGKDFIQLPGL